MLSHHRHGLAKIEFAQTSSHSARPRLALVDPVVVHAMVDPEVIVAGFEGHGEVTTTGERHRMAFIRCLV